MTVCPNFDLLCRAQLAAALARIEPNTRSSEFKAADELGAKARNYLRRHRVRLIFGEFTAAWSALPWPKPDEP